MNELKIRASVVRAITDRDGALKLTLEIPASDAATAAGIALQTQVIWVLTFVKEEPVNFP